jgi:hypothetical protein
MAARNPQPKESDQSSVDLAVGAVVDNFTPLDLDVGDVDTSPTSLGLDDREEAGERSGHRRSRPVMDECIVCGQPSCDDCASS